MSALQLPRLDGSTAHGWLAAVGALRVLSEQWPALRASWGPGEFGSWAPTLHDGPASVDEAVQVLMERTVLAVEPGGVLPGCPAAALPEGRDWYRSEVAESWGSPGSAEEMWHAAIQCPTRGLHPMVRPHAGQTPRRMFTKARALLEDDPGLLREVIAGPGLGLTRAYPGGLWIFRHHSEMSSAAPGYDWLALMALPWMPARDSHQAYDPARWRPEPRTGAAGWTWHHVANSPLPMLRWRLWTDPIPAAAVPAVIDGTAAAHATGPLFAYQWAERSKPSEVPQLLAVGLDELTARAIAAERRRDERHRELLAGLAAKGSRR